MDHQPAPQMSPGLATLRRLAERPAAGEVCDMCAAFVVAPIDACHQLLGLIRRHRRGLSEPAEQVVHAVTLRCQIQIEATSRRYSEAEQSRLTDLLPTREDALERLLGTATPVEPVVP